MVKKGINRRSILSSPLIYLPGTKTPRHSLQQLKAHGHFSKFDIFVITITYNCKRIIFIMWANVLSLGKYIFTVSRRNDFCNQFFIQFTQKCLCMILQHLVLVFPNDWETLSKFQSGWIFRIHAAVSLLIILVDEVIKAIHR